MEQETLRPDMVQEQEQNTSEYEELKAELGQKLDETAENFIIIGYILKQVRDRRLYLNDGYGSIEEFGSCQYGLDRSSVNRFININTKFSTDGNSREIDPRYKGYGRSKLQEMLSIDGQDMELITAETTTQQIRDLKEAEKEQRQLEAEEQAANLPLVQMAADPEEKSREPRPEPEDPFTAVMTAFWKENTELYRKIKAGILTPEIVAEEISPSGSRTYKKGVNIMFFYDCDRGAKLRSYEKGKAQIIPYTYRELLDKTLELNIFMDKQETKEEIPAAPEDAGEKEKIVATPQPISEEQETPYIPMPGQISVENLQDIIPDAKAADTDKNAETIKGTAKETVDGEYRELDIQTPAQQTITDVPYTDYEIKRAIEYFDIEYSRMVSLHIDGLKKTCYKIARECIRRCYKSTAEEMDKSIVTGA